MSTALDDRPQLHDTDTSDDSTVHLVCMCNADLALCGKDVSKREFVEGDSDEEDCVLCEIVDDEIGCPSCGW